MMLTVENDISRIRIIVYVASLNSRGMQWNLTGIISGIALMLPFYNQSHLLLSLFVIRICDRPTLVAASNNSFHL